MDAIPSIVVAAKNRAGVDSTAVRLIIDDRVHGEKLDGLPIELDPGEHHLRFELGQEPPIDERIVLIQGERARRIEVSFQPEPDERPPPVEVPLVGADAPAATGLHPLFWVGVAVGGSGLVVGAITGVVSMIESNALRDACDGQRCSEAERERYDRALALSHTSTTGLSVAGAGAALTLVSWLWLSDSAADSGALSPWLAPDQLGVRGAF